MTYRAVTVTGSYPLGDVIPCEVIVRSEGVVVVRSPYVNEPIACDPDEIYDSREDARLAVERVLSEAWEAELKALNSRYQGELERIKRC